jgi:hypothetical protein
MWPNWDLGGYVWPTTWSQGDCIDISTVTSEVIEKLSLYSGNNVFAGMSITTSQQSSWTSSWSTYTGDAKQPYEPIDVTLLGALQQDLISYQGSNTSPEILYEDNLDFTTSSGLLCGIAAQFSGIPPN